MVKHVHGDELNRLEDLLALPGLHCLDAADWWNHGFDASQAQAYLAAGCTSPAVAAQLLAHGIDPDLAATRAPRYGTETVAAMLCAGAMTWSEATAVFA